LFPAAIHLPCRRKKIDYILSSIAEIKNVEVIRIGTRAPVVLPQRIEDNLCKVLEKYEISGLIPSLTIPKKLLRRLFWPAENYSAAA
jgi:hypothetical protein